MCVIEGRDNQFYECGVDPIAMQCCCNEVNYISADNEWCWGDGDKGYVDSYNLMCPTGDSYNTDFRKLSPEEQVLRLGICGSIQNGYLIFQSLPLSNGISFLGLNFVEVFNKAMDSVINHVGIIKYVNGSWRVIEANGDGVRYTKLADFIRRNPDAYWIKKIALLDNEPEGVAKFLQAAHKYFGKPYDFKFEDGDDKIYCSELVSLALEMAGYSIGSIKIPTSWLNGYDKSVQEYLLLYHQVMNPENMSNDWFILPPHILFYSDYLTDPVKLPSEYCNYPKNGPIKNNILYDTIPGNSVDEKYLYVMNHWSGYFDKVKVSISGNNYYFRFLEKMSSDDTIQHSLTLLGIFVDEKNLTEKLLRILVRK